MGRLQDPKRSESRAGDARAQAQLALTFLHGTVAAMRCRSFVQRRAWPEARHELNLLDAIVRQVEQLALDEETALELTALTARAAKLHMLIAQGAPAVPKARPG